MNISEFAEYAGVSKSAVSRYFNNGYLSDDKREKIEKAIEETGYSPSISAQAIKTRVTKLVGVIIPKLSSESCARITEGISQVLYEHGYQILLVNTANDYNKEIEYLDLFRQNRVDGVIFLATVFTDVHRSLLKKMHIPVVITGQEYKGFSCVCHDDFGAAYALTELMLHKGAVRPAYIGVTDDDKAAGEARHKGFLKALADNDISLDKHNSVIAEFNIDSGYSCAKKIFSGREHPDCIFCATDNIAAGAILYCRENGIKIPEDVMMCGVGDSKIGAITAVPLTSARLHYKTAGIEAAQMLLNSIGRASNVPKIMKLDYEIVERESTNR
ncbi:MAG: LacI family DNA-binding transcriptional regulator [Oscillospiraceae bacterium]|nr:LacI family DNA-binding transcriptional regulator [Oscillospiraceae bacterium]MDD7279233.1 LacI family DNA-binding transcriptional regulator [Oscillospiraceae bacterium]MDY2863061.1 LacI family DNA-binding transcriptional regulator [Oscillospiraceae bacterium]